MTKQSTFKRSVRARMEKTGESYTAARSAMLADGTTAGDEFDGKVGRLVACGFPAAAELTEDEFRRRLAPLARSAPATDFAIVVAGISPIEAVALLSLKGKPGFTSMTEEDLARFEPTADAQIPEGFAYLVADIDLGEASLNVPPAEALPGIVAAGRSPLTIAEGLAILAQDTEALRERNCFSLLGSRCGDKRVPALWVKADGRPRLGWCWNGAPHTWLGSASCGARIGAEAAE